MVERVRVVKIVSFDAAHYLPNYLGKCSQMHGHHWVVELAVSGQVMEEYGFVVDFTQLKDWLKENVVELFDHKCLNDFLPIPTAEKIALLIRSKWSSLVGEASEDIKLDFVRVWETPDSYVEVRGE